MDEQDSPVKVLKELRYILEKIFYVGNPSSLNFSRILYCFIPYFSFTKFFISLLSSQQIAKDGDGDNGICADLGKSQCALWAICV